MKKYFLLAAMVGVALTGCVSNEPDLSGGGEKEITFSTPVVGKTTRALIDGTEYPSTESFGVYAWYYPDNTTTATTEYMSKVEVKLDANLTDKNTNTNGESGGWEPSTPYYWPKNGTLKFDAFSPYSVASCVGANATEGLVFTNYTVSDPADVDLLYATRTTDKTSSTDTEETTDNTKYDGVDIAFKHALSAVQIKAKTQGNYSREIRITSLEISEVENTNTFKQNVNLATVETPDAAAWATREQGTTPSTAKYSYITTSDGDAAKVVPFVGTDGTTTILDCGTKILLPQAVQNSDIKLIVNYEIEYGVAGENNTKTYLAQTTSFDLKEYLSTTTENVSITNWEMGKRYIYTLVFTLDEIFFEPSVTDWVDVTIGETTPTI